jgi:hypothetical protein
MQSPSIGAIAAALAKAQGEFKPAFKDASNPFFKSKYVDLAGAIEACRAALSNHGLAVVQTMEDGERLRLSTTLIHASGEWISSQYPVIPVKNDPQGIGSALTYARRYSLMAIVGLAAEDDDGNAASGREPTAQPALKVATVTGEIVKAKPKWSDEQRAEAGAMRAEMLAIDAASDKEVADLQKRMAYDAPTDVIDAMAVLLRKWRDIAATNNKE